MHIVVFSDRDGTINKDEDYYLGSKPNWREQLEFLPGVVEGIKLINKIPDSHLFIITNQSGVALDSDEFKELTEERMHEVNAQVVKRLKKEGAIVENYFANPYVDSAYAKKSELHQRKVNPKYVQDNHPDLKPNTGMFDKALASLKLDRSQCQFYMIGDRQSDIESGLSIHATSILVPSWKTKDDLDKVRKMKGSIHIAKNFLEAAQLIAKQNQ